jgi:manganese-dependent inorganic pyrophosphatase
MTTPIYVVGHVNPDTDSIASAMGYAWLLRERDGADTVAARAGAVNPQTAWVLKQLGIDAPILLTDASPRFESVMRRMDTTTPEQPLSEAWAIASRTGGIAPVLNEDGTPFGLITGRSLFNFLSQLVGPKFNRADTNIREILEVPCREAADTTIAKFLASGRIRDVLNRILRDEGDEFWVVDEDGLYRGICRQRDLLNPPRLKIVMVDHNEVQQAVASVEEADLLEILDHHRLGNPSTHTPIKFTVDIVGSTSTLVAERIEEAGLSAPAPLAGIMLAGLLSDTLILNSPTTTARDKQAAERLGRWAFIRSGPIPNETVQSYGEKVLAAGAGLGVRSPKDIVNGDMKVYSAGGFQFAIAQAEVSDLYEMSDHIDALMKALTDLKDKRALDFSMLMITDIVSGSSRLLIANQPPVLDDLPYPQTGDGTRIAEGVVSRKKQLLPVVLGLLES